MEFLLNPSISYLMLVAAVLFTLVAILTPGTGIRNIGDLGLLLRYAVIARLSGGRSRCWS
jgi:hypothetical protein